MALSCLQNFCGETALVVDCLSFTSSGGDYFSGAAGFFPRFLFVADEYGLARQGARLFLAEVQGVSVRAAPGAEKQGLVLVMLVLAAVQGVGDLVALTLLDV